MKLKLQKLNEHQLQKTIISYLEYRKDIYFIRNNSVAGKIVRSNGTQGWINNAKRGSPDIVLCKGGLFLGLEIKSQQGRQSEFQKQAEKDIKKVGGQYFLIRSLEDLFKIIEK